MSEIKTVADLATAASNVLAERGWCTGENQIETGEVCLMGAVNIAAYGSAYPWPGMRTPTGKDPQFTNPAILSLAEGFKTAGLFEQSANNARIWLWNDNQTDVDVIRDALKLVSLKCTRLPADLTIPEVEPRP